MLNFLMTNLINSSPTEASMAPLSPFLRPTLKPSLSSGLSP